MSLGVYVASRLVTASALSVLAVFLLASGAIAGPGGLAVFALTLLVSAGLIADALWRVERRLPVPSASVKTSIYAGLLVILAMIYVILNTS